jgi:hypothetical protein
MIKLYCHYLVSLTTCIPANLDTARSRKTMQDAIYPTAFIKHRKRLVSLPAKPHAVVSLTDTVFGLNWLIGGRFNNEEVEDNVRHWYVS